MFNWQLPIITWVVLTKRSVTLNKQRVQWTGTRHSSQKRVLRKLMSQLSTTNRVIFVMTWVDCNKHRTVTIRLCTFFHSCLFTSSLLSRTDSSCFNVFSRRMFDIVTQQNFACPQEIAWVFKFFFWCHAYLDHAYFVLNVMVHFENELSQAFDKF